MYIENINDIMLPLWKFYLKSFGCKFCVGKIEIKLHSPDHTVK